MDHTTARSPARARVLAFRGHGPRNERRHGNARARLRLLRDLPGARAGPDRLRACPGDGRAGREPGVRRAPSRAPAVALVARPVAVITGAPRGMGLESARQLAPTHRVALLDRDAEGAERAAAQIGGEAIHAPCDITDADAVTRAVAEVVDRCGGIDVAIANTVISTGRRQ